VPSDRTIKLPPASRKIVSATYLRDNDKAAFKQSDDGISLFNVADKNNEPDLIIKLVLK
jgi:hypothetical protein